MLNMESAGLIQLFRILWKVWVVTKLVYNCWPLRGLHLLELGIFLEMKIVQVFFSVNNQAVCYVSKTFVFQCIKGSTIVACVAGGIVGAPKFWAEGLRRRAENGEETQASTIGKYPAFLGLFVWIEKGRKLRSRILSNAAHAQLTRKL